MKVISINTSKPYDVVIGCNIIGNAGSLLKNNIKSETIAVICDDNVSKLYSKALCSSLENSSFRTVQFVFPHGESSKNAENYLAILNFLAEKKISRSDAVIALGGGVTGDLAGFAAATYMRGIPYIQIPTTLLAAVDSSIGGKTAIDLTAGKNLAGAFYQPSLVICDTETFSTLPTREFKNGIGEIIKHGFLAGEDKFRSLEVPIHTNLEETIAWNIEVKRDVVVSDEFELGPRKLLNFGHTIGHAIEYLSSYKISHGEAVAAGMSIETRMAYRMGLCSEECVKQLHNMIKLYDFETNTSCSPEELIEICLMDKKRSGSSISLVLPLDIGNSIIKEIPINDLENYIKLGLEEI